MQTQAQKITAARQRLWHAKHPGYNAASCARNYASHRKARLAYQRAYDARKQARKQAAKVAAA